MDQQNAAIDFEDIFDKTLTGILEIARNSDILFRRKKALHKIGILKG
jgi:hypothetical protein